MLPNYILGINPCINGMNYHDPSACLMLDGLIVFASEEERFNGIKHSNGIFPISAVKHCVDYVNLHGGDIKTIAVSYNPLLWKTRLRTEIFRTIKRSRLLEIIGDKTIPDVEYIAAIRTTITEFTDILDRLHYFENVMSIEMRIKNECQLPKAKVLFFEHHLSHAASAYYTSGFSEALCVVIDGTGESATTSIWKANKTDIIKIHEVSMPNSLGYFYAAATAYAGFEPWNQEGKLMALAPYGKPNIHIRKKLIRLSNVSQDGYNVEGFIGNCLIDGLALDIDKAKTELASILGVKFRESNSEISDWYKDFAFEVQRITEQAVKTLVMKWVNVTGIKHVCCAGGLFMNCKMNMALRKSFKDCHMFIQPVAGDAGTSLGAALLATNNTTKVVLESLSLGLDFTDSEIENALVASKVSYQKCNNISKVVAQLLADNKIVAWFNGKSEFGCRALGHRSILASPKEKDMADTLNRRIKHREVWRPFACSVLGEKAKDILVGYTDDAKASYMIEAYNIKTKWQKQLGAVMHIADKTTRPQVVYNEAPNQEFFRLIKEFYEITGIPLILNTSFNDKGQPIVLYPKQAIEFFVKHDVDALALNDYLVLR